MVLLQVVAGSFEFYLFFVMTMLIIATKAILLFYVGRKLMAQKRETGSIKLSFSLGIFVLLLCLLISRLIYIYFDFVLTQFDASTYYIPPNYIYWKVAMLIASIGIAFMLYVTDKKVMNFKLKGIVALIPIIGAIIMLIYPINTADDFAFISGLSIVSTGAIAILLFFFIYVAVKSTGSVRKNALLIVVGGLLYAVAALIINESILTPLRIMFGNQIHIFIFFLFMALKISGLILMTYAFTKFSL